MIEFLETKEETIKTYIDEAFDAIGNLFSSKIQEMQNFLSESVNSI